MDEISEGETWQYDPKWDGFGIQHLVEVRDMSFFPATSISVFLLIVRSLIASRGTGRLEASGSNEPPLPPHR
jgi:hypothetical protein